MGSIDKQAFIHLWRSRGTLPGCYRAQAPGRWSCWSRPRGMAGWGTSFALWGDQPWGLAPSLRQLERREDFARTYDEILWPQNKLLAMLADVVPEFSLHGGGVAGPSTSVSRSIPKYPLSGPALQREWNNSRSLLSMRENLREYRGFGWVGNYAGRWMYFWDSRRPFKRLADTIRQKKGCDGAKCEKKNYSHIFQKTLICSSL